MHINAQIQQAGTRGIGPKLWLAALQMASWLRGSVAAFNSDKNLYAGRELQAKIALDESRLLRQAVAAKSAYEIDWLIYAALVTDRAKRRYCLERALAINPQSELAATALRRLAKTI